MDLERGRNGLRGESSPSNPSPHGSGFFREPRGFGWNKVEAILRTYVAGGARPGMTTYGERGHGIQRGAHASELWRATIAGKLERDPNRVMPRQWALELQMPLEQIRRYMRVGALETLERAVKPQRPRINVAGLWAEVDATLSNLESVVADIERKNLESGGQLRELRLEVHNKCRGWLDICFYFRGHYAYKRSMKWLGQEFKRCADADPSFLRHVEY